MVGIALIRNEYCPDMEYEAKEVVGVFKTYESAFIAMADDRSEWKKRNDVLYEDEKSLQVNMSDYSGMVSMDISYELIPVKKIEA